MLDLCHVLFGGSLVRERPRQHEFGFEHGFGPLHNAVEGRCHPGDGAMLYAALDISDAPTSVALVPGAVEFLGGGPELHDEVAGQVLRFGLTSLLAPEAGECGVVTAH